MDLSIKEVARILNVSETTVRNHIAAGKLPARRKGRHIVVSRSDLGAFATSSPPPLPEEPDPGHQEPDGPKDKDHAFILELLSHLSAQMDRFHEMLLQNQTLVAQVRSLEGDLARKDMEIEQLRRDLIHQSRMHEKELEEQVKILQEKWSVLEKEGTERTEREREHFESMLAREQSLWSERFAQEQNQWAERLAQEREHHVRRLHEMSCRESFWSRLTKMMTWS
ncbi:MAG: helix-turn-helix domain-containing protein [Deltaproteobacteria bacterium]|nr:helix-turn-helix domain-containing protein [Deltaproteobacteria bacterium]